MARQIVGVDLGTYSIKIVKIENKGRGIGFVVTSFIQELLNLDYSKILDQKQIFFAQKKILQKLYKHGSLVGDVFITALPANYTYMQNFSVPFNDKKMINSILDGLLDITVPFKLIDFVYPWVFVNLKKTLILNKDSNEYNINIAFARKSAIINHLKLLSKVKIDPRIVNIKSFALFELFNFFLDSKKIISNSKYNLECFAILDLGHTSSNLCVFYGNKILLSRNIFCGGINILKAISSKMNISFEQSFNILQKSKLYINKKHYQGSELKIDNAIKNAFQPIIKELRKTFFNLAYQGECNINSVFLVGGLSKMKNICKYFSSQLDNKFILAEEKRNFNFNLKNHSEFASSLSFALQGIDPFKKENRLNFRIDKFVYSGEINFLRLKINTVAYLMLIIFVLICFLCETNKYLLNIQENSINKKRVVLCNNILRKKNISASRCLDMINKKNKFKKKIIISSFSVNNILIEISKVLPKELNIKIVNLEISNNLAYMNGITNSFENIDKIVVALSRGLCFSNIVKGKAYKSSIGINFSIKIEINCKTIKKQTLLHEF